MDVALVLKFLLLFLLFILSAFFSGSETALFSLDPIKIKRLTQGFKSPNAVFHLLDNPVKTLSTILAGNTLVDIAISAIITSLLIDIFGSEGIGISIGISTLVLLIFGEVIPKTVAIHNNERLSKLVAGPLYVFSKIFAPLLWLATRICDRFILFLRLENQEETALTQEELKTVVEVGHRHGVVGKNEKEMIVSILELTTTTAQEVMTPRTDIKAISADWPQEQVVNFAREAKCAKFPVFRGSYDNILGMVYAKDIFLEEAKPYAEFIKPVMFVPASKKIDELIKEFYKQKTKMAIVVDEYGGTSGLVTLEDVVEEIFGEIYDEFETKESLVEPVRENVYRISGKTSIYQVNDDCGIHVPVGDYDTIAGYLLDIFGRIPAENERIMTKWGIFVIEKIAGRRIQSILLEKA